MKEILSVLAIICFFSGISYSQKNKDDIAGRDFIINVADDTVWGKISGNLTPSTASLKINFTDNKTSTKRSYKPYQIKSWHPQGLNYYFESKEYRPKGLRAEDQGYAVFMKCFTPYEGSVRYYEYYNTDGSEGYYQSFLQKRGEMIEVKFEKFYAQLAEYFSDYPELSAKIKDKKFKKTQLAEIVDEYNIWYNRKA
jgi:hypothetical protein